jgi:uncharacterized phiE125 gp8 family phage protein
MWRSLVCTVPGAPALDLAKVKADLRIDHAVEDTTIAGYIAAAQAMLEGPSGLGLALKPSTWRLALDAFPPDEIRLDLSPVASVVSVTYVDTLGATITLDPGEYRLDLAARPARLAPAFGKSWPATRPIASAVLVTFTAGAATVPADLALAMTLLVGHWYANREATAPSGLAALPHGVGELLAPHRQHAI